MRKLANHAARDIASPAVKMGNKGLFPGVAVPLAFFCTLFFRHRKKSVSAPWDGKSQSAPESARHSPPGQGVCACGRTKGLSARPLEIFGSPPKAIERPIGLQALFPRRSRRVIPRRGRGLRLRAHWGLSARPQSPSGRVGEKTQGHAFLQKTQRAFLGANNRRGPHSALSLPPTPRQAVRTNVRTACFWEPRMPVRGHSTKFSCRLPAALAEVSVAQTRRGLILPLFAQTGQNQNNDRDQIGERFENLLHAPI